jgi:hypothetical protein
VPGLRKPQDPEETFCGGVLRVSGLGIWRQQLHSSRRIFLSRLIHCSRELRSEILPIFETKKTAQVLRSNYMEGNFNA